MIQMNVGDHTGDENGDGFIAIPSSKRDQVRWARNKMFSIVKNIASADVYFKSLPKGRSLTSLINDASIWINYDPTISYYGYTYSNNDLWIGPLPFKIGRWTVLATIIHELAHIDGAGGGDLVCSAYSAGCHAAELAVLHCGLGYASETPGKNDPFTPYDPDIFG